MTKPSIKLVLILLSMSLTSCSSMQSLTSYPSSTTVKEAANQGGGTFVTSTGTTVPVATVSESNQPLGGEGARSMDEIDKSKLSHALDSPLGKATHWENGNTGINYTVVPTQKVTINGNSLCRKYQVTLEKGDKSRQINGTACISTDGNWHPI